MQIAAHRRNFRVKGRAYKIENCTKQKPDQTNNQ